MKYDDVTTNPIWRTAAILKIVFWLYLNDFQSVCLLCAFVHTVLSFHPTMRSVALYYQTIGQLVMCFIFLLEQIFFDTRARTPKLCNKLMLLRITQYFLLGTYSKGAIHGVGRWWALTYLIGVFAMQVRPKLPYVSRF